MSVSLPGQNFSPNSQSLETSFNHAAQNMFGISRSVKPEKAPVLQNAISGQRQQISSAKNHFLNTYTPALDTARNIVANNNLNNFQVKNSNNNLYYQNTNGQKVSLDTFVVQTQNGQPPVLVDLVGSVARTNSKDVVTSGASETYSKDPQTVFQTAYDRLNVIDEKLERLQGRAGLTRSDERKIQSYNAEAQTLIGNINSLVLRSADNGQNRSAQQRSPASTRNEGNAFESRHQPMAQGESSRQAAQVWPAYTNEETAVVPAAQAAPPELPEVVNTIQSYYARHTNDVLLQKTAAGDYWVHTASRAELTKLNENYAAFHGYVSDQIKANPALAPYIENNPTMQQFKQNYETILLPILIGQGVIPRAAEI